MSGIWLSGNRASDEGGWLDFIDLRNRRIIFAFDIGSIAIVILLIISGTWIGIDAKEFVEGLESPQQSSLENDDDFDMIKIDGRWPWEAKLLLDSCTPLNGTWNMPEILHEQDEIFWYPGEVECIWDYNGIGDRAVIAIRNAASTNQDFTVNLSTNNDGNSIEEIRFGSTGNSLTVDANESGLISIFVNTEINIEYIYAKIESSINPNASVLLKIALVSGDQHGVHIEEGQRLDVHYKVYIYDTGELLDEGDLPVTAGEDPMCGTGAPWFCYIKGFGWGQVGLDCTEILTCRLDDYGAVTTNTVLLPPDLAYKNQDDRPEANNQWLQFELTLNRLLF